MSSREKRVLQIWIVLILVATFFGVAALILPLNVWGILIVSGVVSFGLYWFYAKYHASHKHRKKHPYQPRYPLVPPEGKGDAYLPRTKIPRPIYADFQRAQEEKKRFDRIDKWRRKITGKKS